MKTVGIFEALFPYLLFGALIAVLIGYTIPKGYRWIRNRCHRVRAKKHPRIVTDSNQREGLHGSREFTEGERGIIQDYEPETTILKIEERISSLEEQLNRQRGLSSLISELRERVGDPERENRSTSNTVSRLARNISELAALAKGPENDLARRSYEASVQVESLYDIVPTLPRVMLGTENAELVAFQILDLIEPEGGGAALARLPALNEWLRQNHPELVAEPISSSGQDLWLLLVLTSEKRTGVVIPALDSIVGPGEVLKWFDGGRYDGTQSLSRANVVALATAARDETTKSWRPTSKGKIDLEKHR